MWKWYFFVTFLAVAGSDKGEDAININLSDADLLKIFPNQKERLQGLSQNLANADEYQMTAVLNDYVDDVLVNLNKFIIDKAFDPVELPEIEEEFSWKIWLITYWGSMHLKNGWLQGLGTMKRTGDATVKYSYPEINIKASLGYQALLFNYDYRAKFMGIGPSGSVDGRVKGTKFTFELNLNMTNLRARIDKFKINSLGSIRLRFRGSILIDWILNIFVSVTIPMVKPILKLVIQGSVLNILNLITDTYNGVICTILGDCPQQLANLIY